jgi:Fic family protein
MYYSALEAAQKGDGDVTDWLIWFLDRLGAALKDALNAADHVLRKARFWDVHRSAGFNERQIKIVNRLLDGGFEGKLTSSKWAKLMKCSQDTAGRDLKELVEKNALRKGESGGRSTHYEIVLPEEAPS